MRTPGELEDALDEDLAWRRIEMHSILSQIRAARGPSRTGLCRAGVALLYAHWEGYAKKSLSNYLQYVARRKLKNSELQDCFVALAIEAAIAKEQNLTASRRSVRRITMLRDTRDDRPFIPSRDGIDTQSNLNSDVLFDLMTSLGLSPAPFETKTMLIDHSLLTSRNKIAHGEFLALDHVGYEELHYEVISIIETIRNLVVDAVSNQLYRKRSASP
ncbi:MAE_28990/MAE_18760 family HEPN-like nuclease [Streptomyces sp. SJL17-4]|uniref:MAE_28990/MAE_18760 family HEPN-like nuclease n=1 Tax=Streptomyces sp. SJL17-4 TaxID=2967224 RepID=UPI0030D326A6